MTELLAPAGSLDTVLTAIDAGADAVYLGGKSFNARKFAHNLDEEELDRAVRTAHLFAVKVYITVNILIADTELKEVAVYLKKLDALHVDGIIVQDLAIAAWVQKVVPNLPLHGSTQLTVADLNGVRFLESLGFTQVVLARELSIQEIRYICHRAKAAIEVFIHGASCMSYSGQCLMSSFIGGRSGNRGACAQPCRLPYQLVEEGGVPVTEPETYVLSLKDLSSVSVIQELIDAGVSSFKIEGRMKGNGYVRSVVGAYRMVMDTCIHDSSQERQHILEKAEHILAESFNRMYQHDFLTDTVERNTITEKSAGNTGRHMGKILKCQEGIAEAKLTEPLHMGDFIKITAADGRECFDEISAIIADKEYPSTSYTVKLRCKEGFSGEIYRLARKEDRKTKTVEMNRKIPLYFHVDVTEGNQLRLTAWDEAGHVAEEVSAYVVQKAVKHPADREWIYTQLNRLGGTFFSVAGVTVWNQSYMIPASILNTLRREAAAVVEQKILTEYHRPAAGKTAIRPDGTTKYRKVKQKELVVRCDSLEGITAALHNGADRIVYGGESYTHTAFGFSQWKQAVDMVHNTGASIWAASPRILRQRDEVYVRKELQIAVSCGADGIYAGALGILAMAKEELWTVPIAGDWSLNTFNAHAADLLRLYGCSSLTLSTELMLRQIKKIISVCLSLPIEILVEGRLEMMVTEFCSLAAFNGSGVKRRCAAMCSHKKYYLKDRIGEQFPIVTDSYCRNHLLNNRDLDMAPYYSQLMQCGISRFRIEGRGRSSAWIAAQTQRYRCLIDDTEHMLLNKEDSSVTRGHFFHGII
ncbi:MAG: DUF3656 domain-containing protein [Megasphaera sp.]|jgi:putative protease|uniref:DUF3656 domain-containing U32 family peptidase n=1 Tax=Megasphaera sueciensis TaxID=349094 RepID=UPI003D006905|nr:DUF3656 domain-containing protein [Megasphaera sp.]MCI1822685.1 DUF3656 domain-containing protein [Megasphaera sp.]